MWARVARFEGDPADIDKRIAGVQGVLQALPPELEGARFMLLVDRESGAAIGVALFETEEALRRGDEAMNRGAGHAGTRSGVEFYEVPIHNL